MGSAEAARLPVSTSSAVNISTKDIRCASTRVRGQAREGTDSNSYIVFRSRSVAILHTSFIELLRLTSPPVGITFVDEAPPDVPHVSAIEPAGCGYWRRAAAGEVFYTSADDHKRCPVGAHTHNVPLSPDEQQE